MDEQLFTKYLKAKKVTLEMARDRGFPIDVSEKILRMTLPQFMKYYRKETGKSEFSYEFFDEVFEKETIEPVLKELPSKQTVEEDVTMSNLLVFKFSPGSEGKKEFGIAETQTFIDEMKDMVGDIRTGILIIEQPLSNDSKKALETKLPFAIQVFNIKELQRNPSKHMFAPKYKILSVKEQREFFLANPTIKLNQLPIMSVKDPISRYFGLTVGKVIGKRVTHFLGETTTDDIGEYSVVENVPI